MAHQVRGALRAEQYCLLEDRRPSFEGICYDGLDRKASEVIIKDKICGLHEYKLRCVLAGAMASCSRLHKAEMRDSPQCPCCGEEVETYSHIIDDCPGLDHLRYRDFSPEEWKLLPPCVRHHGLIPLRLHMDCTPARYQDQDGPKAMAADVQYTLLDMFLFRDTKLGAPTPIPRW